MRASKAVGSILVYCIDRWGLTWDLRWIYDSVLESGTLLSFCLSFLVPGSDSRLGWEFLSDWYVVWILAFTTVHCHYLFFVVLEDIHVGMDLTQTLISQ